MILLCLFVCYPLPILLRSHALSIHSRFSAQLPYFQASIFANVERKLRIKPNPLQNLDTFLLRVFFAYFCAF